MKQIKVSELKVGDVFIDGDTYSTIEDTTRVFLSKWYIKAKRIIGPTDKHLYLGGLYVPHYLIPINKLVLLCEKT